MKLHNFLQQWIDLVIFRTMKPESTSKAALFETNSQILLFSIFFFYVILKHKRDMRPSYLLLIVFISPQSHLYLPSCQKTCMKKKAFKQIQFFTLDSFTNVMISTITVSITYASFIQFQNSNE